MYMCYFTNLVSRLPPSTGNEFTKSGREPGIRNHVHGPRCRHSIDTALMSVATSKKKKLWSYPCECLGYSTVHRYCATASTSAVSYGQLLTTFWRAGVSKVSPDGSLQWHLCYALGLGVSRTSVFHNLAMLFSYQKASQGGEHHR